MINNDDPSRGREHEDDEVVVVVVVVICTGEERTGHTFIVRCNMRAVPEISMWE